MFDQAHPFTDLVWNRAPWTRVRLTDLADAIRAIEALQGGTRLIERFGRADQHSGAVFELDLAATALRRGLSVRLEPPTQPGRKCDMAVTHGRGGHARTLFLEVQTIQDYGFDTQRAMEIADRLVPPAAWVGLRRELLRQITRIPDDSELAAVLPRTDAFWRRCETSAEPEHLLIDGVLDVWAVPIGHEARAHLVAAGVPENFRSPAPDDPLRRTLRAVRQKIGQLPTLAPGLIVLRPPRLLFLNPRLLPHVVKAIEAAVLHSPQIAAIALVDWTVGAATAPKENRSRLAGAVLVRHPDRHIFVREALIVSNPNRGFREADELMARLL